MKILVVGDPGSGKTIVSLAIAKALSEAGHDVLVVDNDGEDVGNKVELYKHLHRPLHTLNLEGLVIETRPRINRKYTNAKGVKMKDQQVSIPANPGTKKTAKKRTRRKRRRDEKRDPETNPRTRYRGYT